MFPLKERQPTQLSIAPGREPLSGGNTVIEEIFESLGKTEYKPRATTITNVETVSKFSARAFGLTNHIFLTVDQYGSLSWNVMGEHHLLKAYSQLAAIPDRKTDRQLLRPDIEKDLHDLILFMHDRPSLSIAQPYEADPVIWGKNGLSKQFPDSMFLTVNATFQRDRISVYLGIDMETGDRLVSIYAGKNLPENIQNLAGRINSLYML